MTPATRQRRRVRTPVIVVTALAWVGLATTARHGHAMAHQTVKLVDPSVLAALGLMLVAMMAPMTIGLLRDAVERSVPRRRRRVVANVLVGYAAVWVGATAELALVVSAVRMTISPLTATLAAIAVATCWQWSPFKQRCLNRTHAHRAVTAFGPTADGDARRAGVDHARSCLGSCWAMMLAAMLVVPGVPLAAMGIASIWLWAERLDRPARPAWAVRFPTKAPRLALAEIDLRAGRAVSAVARRADRCSLDGRRRASGRARSPRRSGVAR